jgi:hypothetical protein
MPKKAVPNKELYSWDIFRLRGTPAAFIDSVEAPDEQTAVKKATDEYQITNPEQQKRLIAQQRRGIEASSGEPRGTHGSLFLHRPAAARGSVGRWQSATHQHGENL